MSTNQEEPEPNKITPFAVDADDDFHSTDVQGNGSSRGRYPLKLIAKIAAKLLAGSGYKITNISALSSILPRQEHINASLDAINLLDACSIASHTDAEEYAHNKLRKRVIEPVKGITPVRALLIITGRSSQAEALPIFKRFQNELHRPEKSLRLNCSLLSPEAQLTDEEMEKCLKDFRSRHYTAQEVLEIAESFDLWNQRVNIPNARRSSGKNGGRGKKKK